MTAVGGRRTAEKRPSPLRGARRRTENSGCFARRGPSRCRTLKALHCSAVLTSCRFTSFRAQSKTTSSADGTHRIRDRLVGIRASHQENFGVAVLETVAAGLPVVISGEVQLRSFVESHDLGVVVDRTDPAALAAGLRAMLSDEAGRRRVAEAGPCGRSGRFFGGAGGRAVGGDVRECPLYCVFARRLWRLI
nr:glycosyltransferase [Salinibacter ruber]